MRFELTQDCLYKKHQTSDLNRWIWCCILAFLFLLTFPAIYAQQNGTLKVEEQSFTIQWINEFPSSESKQKTGFGEKVSGIIFGEKDIELIKPFAILAENPENFLVLDQGLGTLVKNIDGLSEIPPALRKGNKEYPSLAGMCFFQDNQILFTDSRQNKVFMLSADQKELRMLNDSLDQPTGIAWSE